MADLNFGELRFDNESKENVQRVLSRVYAAAAGPEVLEYEQKWGELFGYKYNTAVYSGTGADTIACKLRNSISRKLAISCLRYKQ